MNYNKVSGSYYTPAILAEFLVEKTMDLFKGSKPIDILEPSCGDGVFLESLLKCSEFLEKKGTTICSVEKDYEALNKAKNYKKNFKEKGINTSFYHDDFLQFSLKRRKKFDLVIGNPPYIYKTYLDKEQKVLSKEILSNYGVHVKTVYNIWIPFIISCTKLLKRNGVLCFVLPSEMLQVKYAEPVRRFLFDNFEEIQILSFEEQIFDKIDQDVVVFTGVKRGLEKHISHELLSYHENGFQVIEKNIHNPRKYFDKWLWYLLSPEEINLVESLKGHFNKTSYYCNSGVGIVTGHNEYFILNEEEVIRHNLQKWVKPIVKKGSYIKDSLKFSKEQFDLLIQDGTPCFLLDFNDIDSNKMPIEVENYINKGKEKGINTHYKCKKRKEWFKVPSIWTAEGMFFKRVHIFPKFINNEMNVNITDTGYRISMRDDFEMDSLIFCFYNSLTLLLLELEGRYYGGGVLEITPNEFKNIHIPYYKVSRGNFEKLEELIKQKSNVEDIIHFTDKITLNDGFKIKKENIEVLRRLREKIVNFRVR
ncbi:hypothetical protein CN266_04590 [Bacillus cereus]|uniref:Eco57I restriction-modification methylase domain-containing protein n=1 Tax=Bacillus cereus TaxID=1396 RepID=UPI000BF62E73|nr:N-6 DNA methylase [Bacillus cereus]PFC67952.1 hypothetical protein CN266_04590 [Bacillus cereus]PFJ19584.1 hypothetical protein COI91_18435 [Bacillus cereus]PGX46188.1 hypothetical protein COE37_23065 [Bacillus cereus]